VSKEALRLSPLFLIAVTILSIQCARQSSHESGGQDTGGGVTASSKPQDVNSAIDLAIQLATESDQQRNIFVQFWKSESAKLKSVTPSRIFSNFESATGQKSKFESAVLQAFKQNKVTRLAAGDCPQSIAGKHADASVSALNLSATICFSIGNLTRLTPSVLLKEVLSLLLHEAAHMGGAEENEAVAWQEAFSAYFAKRFGDVPSDSITTDTFKSFSEIRVRLARAQRLAADDPKNSRIIGLLGNIVEKLSSLPYYNDPLAITLKARPAHPELITTYSEAVSALAIKLQAKVQFYGDNSFSTMSIKPETDEPIAQSDIIPLLDEVSRDLDKITENFLAIFDAKSNP
jgi:hypothetical protein